MGNNYMVEMTVLYDKEDIMVINGYVDVVPQTAH